jgi:hypothetical protein
METNWIKTVKRVFKENRATNKNYKFKNALIDAKKIYKNTTRTVDSMGPALANKLAKKIKRTMKKRRGGQDPDDETQGLKPGLTENLDNNAYADLKTKENDLEQQEQEEQEQEQGGGKKKSKKSKKSKTSKKSKK